MVTIKKVTFYNQVFQQEKLISCTGNILLIRQFDTKKMDTLNFSLFIQKQYGKCVQLLDTEDGFLEISLKFPNEFNLRSPWSTTLSATPKLKELTKLFFTYYMSTDSNYSVDQLLQYFVQQLFKVNEQLLDNGEFYLTLLRFIEENMKRPLQVADICSFLHVGEKTLERICKKEAGVSVMALYRSIKCAEANRLLKETGLTIQEISELLGFKNSRYFSTAYKKMEGMTPIEKRQSFRRGCK